MQIDFHHAVTYIACRLAGMEHPQADIVAHAAQYVDDATNDGPLDFSTGQRYVRVTSAHKTLDISINADRADNRLVWVPFHFLPGNEIPAQARTPDEIFLGRMVCKPNSLLAQTMVKDCILKQTLPFSLHRFGIALHTYIDTWAHQQFVGMISDFNRLDSIAIDPDPAYAYAPIFEDLTSSSMRVKQFVAGHLPVGHAAAVTFPDMPFLRWRFIRQNGERVVRDNPTDFLNAAVGMFNMARRYVQADPSLDGIDLPDGDKALVDHMIRTTLSIEGENRHPAWLEAIREGAFSFGPADVSYIEQGPGSWKFEALGADPDHETGKELFSYTDGFLQSNWKYFHDTVQYHRLYILHELLSAAGVCAS